MKIDSNRIAFKNDRLNGLLKDNNIKAFELAAMVGIEPETFSRCKTKKGFPADIAESISKILNVRLQYLTGQDDFKTDNDLLTFGHMADIEQFNICKRYIESLGFKIEPFIICDIPIWQLKRYIDFAPEFVADRMTAAEFKKLLRDYDFNLDHIDFITKYGAETLISIPLIAPFKDNAFSFEQIGKNSGLPDNDKLHSSELFNNSRLSNGLHYSIGFNISENGLMLCKASIKELQQFINNLDKYTRFAVRDILPGMTE